MASSTGCYRCNVILALIAATALYLALLSLAEGLTGGWLERVLAGMVSITNFTIVFTIILDVCKRGEEEC